MESQKFLAMVYLGIFIIITLPFIISIISLERKNLQESTRKKIKIFGIFLVILGFLSTLAGFIFSISSVSTYTANVSIDYQRGLVVLIEGIALLVLGGILWIISILKEKSSIL